MRGLEKLTFNRLAEVMVQEGIVDWETLSGVLQESAASKTPFPELLFRHGIVSEWKLVQAVSREFSLPIIQPSSYSIDKEVMAAMSEALVQETKVLPLDKFGKTLMVAMPLLVPFATLEKIKTQTKLEISPYVAPISQVQLIISEKFAKAGGGTTEDTDWQKLFDEADASLQDEDSP